MLEKVLNSITGACRSYSGADAIVPNIIMMMMMMIVMMNKNIYYQFLMS
jgi:hypothetical protein